MPTVIIQDSGPTQILLDKQTVAQINSSTTITIGGAGIQGPPGPTGQSTNDFVQLPAGAPIYALRAIVSYGGKAYHADPSTVSGDRELLGVATNTANVNDTVNVRVGGQISDISLNFTSGPVYVGMNGTLVQAVPDPSNGFAWIAEVGVAVSSIAMSVEPEFIADF